MEVLEAIKRRRSIGRTGGDLSEELVRELIEAAVWAPNHHLTQPWRFTILRGDARRRLGDFWGELAARENGLQAEAARKFADGQSAKLLRAPLLIVVSTRTDPNPVIAIEDHSATAAAVQNLLLAATARHLGAMWRTGAMVYHPQVKRFLGLDPEDRILGTVYVGQVAGDEPAPAPRDVDAVIRRL